MGDVDDRFFELVWGDAFTTWAEGVARAAFDEAAPDAKDIPPETAEMWISTAAVGAMAALNDVMMRGFIGRQAALDIVTGGSA